MGVGASKWKCCILGRSLGSLLWHDMRYRYVDICNRYLLLLLVVFCFQRCIYGVVYASVHLLIFSTATVLILPPVLYLQLHMHHVHVYLSVLVYLHSYIVQICFYSRS